MSALDTLFALSLPQPTASLSRSLPSTAPHPHLLHSLSDRNNSVLSLAADRDHIFIGTQCHNISVWDKESFTLKATLRGHTGSILALEYAQDKKWLFSSSEYVWSTITLLPIYVLHPYLETGAGDLFSLVWCSSLQTLYIGCQNTSLQWFDFSREQFFDSYGSGTSTPSRKAHKFFDSYPQYQHRPADIFASNGSPSMTPSTSGDGVPTLSVPAPRASLNIPARNVVDSAHFGYIYCMALLPSNREGCDDVISPENVDIQLVTGSGDETVKLWKCGPAGPTLTHTFDCCDGAVLSLAAREETIYAGCQDGYVKIWDLETKTLVRTIIVQENVDVLSLSLMQSDLYTCSANGQIQRWSLSFDCTASWRAHDGIVLSSIVTRSKGSKSFFLLSGANDGMINVWKSETMTYALSMFVSIPSVSCESAHREDCRQAAIWLKKCLHQLGAESTLLSTYEGGNPLVLAKFQGTQTKHRKPRILFYGHYDVISAPSEGWNSDPFTVTGRNGYLYGRGVTDNKGPILAVACAAAELLGKRSLGVDLTMLIEGEEETGSRGFVDAVKKYKNLIGDVDVIILSNSTWITDYPPCITYGLRGVVHCSVEISSNSPDLHSGVEGGAAAEPMMDMINVLATLTDSERKVNIPRFYDDVRPLTEEEEKLYDLLSQVTQRPGSSLSSRWREPSLTVHNIEVSGPKNSTVIPGKVKTQLSLRVVPDQDLQSIANSLVDHLKTSFQKLNSPNEFDVNVNHTADWWLGNLDDPWFQTLEAAVRDEWGVDPLRIREGGSIPSIPYLEREFGCQALHLPLGQSTDQAHLPNERISLSNLRRGKSVFQRFLLGVADNDTLFLNPTKS
ncbi:hypothetical protein SERLA73DRAFT_169073 [Serpula lacrymans var. lacrymans S7.3]|uniref:Peptidase M20 dimerisation domain-containing protein n=2 Tax=Serpula lacrymans var. lacrymans TaxID=341189 RepID=F8Q111_SERL3|nr:uncharacterized protein SERLADRAFT_449925 [Serpula lacrymans var. lacrymans S7.9]EGN97989.1 hypothetical protein SERLA73DRAFT_169073 [Serpula lacrymans var. lacrymans S7.3]EGO23581.1 hypothetical protein SERLADRAFT_449925 [Serpula lacrymans var. lacrymans S7.9]